MSRILAIKSDGGSGALEQMVLAEYCGEHFDTHIAALRKVLRRKAEALMLALKEEFGDAARFDDPEGGIFLWVALPAAVRTTRLAQAALEAGVAINPGGEWVSDPPIGEQRLRLCFAHPPEDIIREGVARLAEVCHREFGIPVRGSRAHR
jgi:2-aminoadipate transaminase